MTPSSDLFNLIQSLTKSEKRFFKLFSSLQAGEKNYFKLFDFIEHQSEYNEVEIKNHFKEERFVSHLPSEKNHLYKLILKSLRQYSGNQTISNQLNQEIKNIELLYNKYLFKNANKILKRAEKIAIENEKFYPLLQLVTWEKKLMESSFKSGNFSINLTEIIQKESTIIQHFKNLSEYQILYSKINAIFRRDAIRLNKNQRKEVEEIKNHPLIKGKNTALSTRAASICYYIQGLCALASKDFKLSHQKFSRVQTILDQHPKIKMDLGQRYILTLFHLMQTYINTRNFSKAQEMIDSIKSLKGRKGFNHLNLQMDINNILITDQIHLYNIQGKFKPSLHLLNSRNKNDKSSIHNSTKEHQIKFYFNSSYTLFAVKDYKSSLRYINKILNEKERELRQDIYSYSSVLNLLLHFELENYDYIDYTSKSIWRKINKQEGGHQIELIFIQQIQKIIKVATQLEVIPIYKETLHKIQLLQEHKEERLFLDHLDIISWLRAKIEGKEFSEVVQNN